jgi:hypothetical protein
VADLNEIIEFQDSGEVGTFNDPFIFHNTNPVSPGHIYYCGHLNRERHMEPSGTIELVHGSNQLYTFTPDENNHVFDVKINGTSIGGFLSSYEFVNLQQNSSIHIEFATGTFIDRLPAAHNLVLASNPVSRILCLQRN